MADTFVEKLMARCRQQVWDAHNEGFEQGWKAVLAAMEEEAEQASCEGRAAILKAVERVRADFTPWNEVEDEENEDA